MVDMLKTQCTAACSSSPNQCACPLLVVPVPVPVPVPDPCSPSSLAAPPPLQPSPPHFRNDHMQKPTFDHEKLDVYRLSITFVGHANAIVRALPIGNAPIADQLMRAATSVSLNIAEGAGEYSGKEKARFYRMAKRSATECAAVLDVCKELNLAPRDALVRGREQLLRIVSMLVKLAQAVA